MSEQRPHRSLIFNLEPTFRCNLGCEMCPRFSSEDPQLDMSAETYRRILESADWAHTVDYTGWGEPMLHKGIYDMVRQARARGCRTTMTSNGTVLTEKNIQALIEAGLNTLTVSIDGLRPETYDAIRIGASLEKVTRNLRNLTRIASRHGHPDLGIAFTVQECNAEDLPQLAAWCRSVGARTVHLKHLNVISTAEDWRRSFLKYHLEPSQSNGDGPARTDQAILSAADEARSLGMQALIHSQVPVDSEMKPRYCLAAPLDTVYFSFEGRVAPCCHFGHHVSRYFEGKHSPPSALFFGDIRRQGFEDIWQGEAFAAFRRGFQTRDYPRACRSCYLLYGK